MEVSIGKENVEDSELVFSGQPASAGQFEVMGMPDTPIGTLDLFEFHSDLDVFFCKGISLK